MSSQVWMKPPLFWNGVIHGTWVAAKTSSTMSSARSACPSGECAHGVMIMLTSRHATSALPSAAWLFATYKLTHSTALRFKRSMVFPTRAHIHLSSRQWTSPQIRLVGIAAVPCQPVKDPYWTCSCCQLSNTGKKELKDCHRIFSVLKKKSSFSYMHVGVCYIFSLWTGIEMEDSLLNELRKGPVSSAHSMLCIKHHCK